MEYDAGDIQDTVGNISTYLSINNNARFITRVEQGARMGVSGKLWVNR